MPAQLAPSTLRALAAARAAGIQNGAFDEDYVSTLAEIAGLGAAVTGAGLLAPSAVAKPTEQPSSQQRTVQVQGRQMPVAVANGEWAMRGDLVGSWVAVPRSPELYSSPTLYVDAGTVVFTGCIDRNRNGRCGERDVNGVMYAAYIAWAGFDENGDLIKGQCVHPITGGTGAFVGARGLVTMVDTPVGNKIKTVYRRTIARTPYRTSAPHRRSS